MAGMADPADTSIDDSWLENRYGNVLRRSGVLTVGDLLKLSAHDVVMIKNSGRKVLHHVRAALAARGMSLRDEVYSGEVRRARMSVPQTVGFKVSEPERILLEAAANAAKVPLSVWARETLIASARSKAV